MNPKNNGTRLSLVSTDVISGGVTSLRPTHPNPQAFSIQTTKLYQPPKYLTTPKILTAPSGAFATGPLPPLKYNDRTDPTNLWGRAPTHLKKY